MKTTYGKIYLDIRSNEFKRPFKDGKIKRARFISTDYHSILNAAYAVSATNEEIKLIRDEYNKNKRIN